jgi:hypothetical protein
MYMFLNGTKHMYTVTTRLHIMFYGFLLRYAYMLVFFDGCRKHGLCMYIYI